MRQFLLMLVLSFSSMTQAAVGVFPDSVFQNLDHGLYWFGYGDS